MINDIPADIPPAIIQYANQHYNNPDDAKTRWIRFVNQWYDKEVYAMHWGYNEVRKTGHPILMVYDCKDVRPTTFEEYLEILYILPKYLYRGASRHHLCNMD